MTTGSGKKTPKTGKVPASRGRRKKVVAKAPAPAEIDKAKMAAFFSAAGLEESAPNPEKDSVKEAAEVEESKKAELKASDVQAPAEPTPTPVSESAPADEPQPAADEPEKVEAVVAAAPAVMAVTESEDSDSKKGETVMTTSSPATSGGSSSGSSSSPSSGSFSILPMLFVLAALAVGWFYYVSSVPLKKMAIAQVEQSKAEISVLMSKVKALEAEVTRLRIKLGHFEKAAMKRKKAAVKASTSVKKGVVTGKKATFKGEPVSAAVKQGSSFDKAPIPFWRQMKPRGPLTQKTPKKGKSVVETPALKVDSFSKAPKPFWLKPRVKPEAVKVKKEVKLSAPTVAKAAQKSKEITSKEKPAAAPILDPSFKKAPKPFWLKD